MRIVRRVRADIGVLALTLASAGALATSGCVQPFDGSNVQIDFGTGVQANAAPGEPVQPDQPPANTHFVLYGAKLVYQLDADGHKVLDGGGDPVILQSFLFEVQRFQIKRAIDNASPCFIDLENTRFPGVHVTQYAAALRAATGITDPYAPGQDPDDVIDVLTAERRMFNLPRIQSDLRAVVSHTDYRYPAVGTQCLTEAGVDRMLIPPAISALTDQPCIDPESDALRLKLCEAAWSANPTYFEGSDKVFTLPLNGDFFGMVTGRNPINDGFVGGSGFFVPTNLVGLDAYLLNWQYDDLDHNGAPDVPAGEPSSPTGFVYMQGTPVQVTRGTLTVSLRHPTNSRITATMVIFPNLGSDDIHF